LAELVLEGGMLWVAFLSACYIVKTGIPSVTFALKLAPMPFY
jgi:hypothetical protein